VQSKRTYLRKDK